MFKINVANSAAIGGSKIFDDVTVGEVIADAEFAPYLTTGSMSMNGILLTAADYGKTLSEMGLSEERPNYLVAIKNANGAF